MKAKNKDWVIVKAVLPPGMIHRAEEQRTRDLFENDRDELSRRLSDHYKRFFLDLKGFDQQVKAYQLAVRSERMRTAGKKLLEALLEHTLAIPSKKMDAREYSLWAQGYIPRSKVYSRKKDIDTLRARVINTDDYERQYETQKDRFSNDNEFQRAIGHMKDLGMIEERDKIKQQAPTFYRLMPFSDPTLSEPWCPEEEPIVKTKNVLQNEFLLWTGVRDMSILGYDFGLKFDEHIRTKLIEIFGEDQVQRLVHAHLI